MIIIYTRDFCLYCSAAKSFLKKQGIEFEERKLERGSEEAMTLSEISGITSVPQIFDGKISQDTCIGGYDDMMERYRAGEVFQ